MKSLNAYIIEKKTTYIAIIIVAKDFAIICFEK